MVINQEEVCFQIQNLRRTRHNPAIAITHGIGDNFEKVLEENFKDGKDGKGEYDIRDLVIEGSTN